MVFLAVSAAMACAFGPTGRSLTVNALPAADAGEDWTAITAPSRLTAAASGRAICLRRTARPTTLSGPARRDRSQETGCCIVLSFQLNLSKFGGWTAQTPATSGRRAGTCARERDGVGSRINRDQRCLLAS